MAGAPGDKISSNGANLRNDHGRQVPGESPEGSNPRRTSPPGGQPGRFGDDLRAGSIQSRNPVSREQSPKTERLSNGYRLYVGDRPPEGGSPEKGPSSKRSNPSRAKALSTRATSGRRQLPRAPLGAPYRTADVSRTGEPKMEVSASMEGGGSKRLLERCGAGKGYLNETQSGSFRPSGLRLKRAEG
jgi:hypothetical protein